MAFPSMIVEFSPGEGPLDTPSWVDLSSRVRSAEWRVGRERDLDEWPSGEATIVLDNSDRVLDPEYTAGTYYGSLNPRTPFRIRTRASGLVLTGAGTSFASATAANVPIDGATGDFTFRAKIAPTDITPAADMYVKGQHDPFTPANGGLSVWITTAGNVFTQWCTGAAVQQATTTATLGASGLVDGQTFTLEVTLDADNGAAGRTVTFRHSLDDGLSWTNIGAPVTAAGTTVGPANAVTGPQIGRNIFGTALFTGSIYRIEEYDGLDPATWTPVYRALFEHASPTAASGTMRDSAYGFPWTLGAAATITASGAYVDEFYGYVEDGFEQTYDAPAQATCTVRLVDLLGVLAGSRLPGSPLAVEIENSAPLLYWPLDETTGNTAHDEGIQGGPGNYSDGTTSLSENGEITFASDSYVYTTNRDALLTALPPTDYTLVAVVQPVAGVSSGTRMIVQGWHADPSAAQYGMALAKVGGNWLLQATENVAYGTLPSTIFDDGPALLVIRSSSGAIDIEANGVTYFTGFGADAPETYGVWVGAAKPNGTYAGFDCMIRDVAIFDTPVAATPTMYEAMRTAWDGDTTGERIDRILNALGIPSAIRNVDAGYTVLGPADYSPGDSALDYLRTITRTEGGALYVDHRDGGKLRFRDRYRLYLDTASTTSGLTFTDADVPGSIHYERGSLVVEPNGIASIVNQVSVSWAGGEITVESEASALAYGPQGTSIDTIAATVGSARDLADFLLGRYAQPQVRVRGLTVTPSADANAYDAALRLGVGERVTVRRLPQGVGSEVSSPSIVEGYAQSVENGVERRATFYLSNAETGSFWIWGVSAWDVSTKWGY